MAYALAVFRFTRPMMGEPSSRHVAQQLFRAATSVAANYRSACLGRSRQEFVAKLGVVREEADEVLFWLEFASLSGLTTKPKQSSCSTKGANWRRSSQPPIAQREQGSETRKLSNSK